MKTKLVIFGITGDLSRRKLLPALDHILARDDQLSIVGVSRREVDVAELLTTATGSAKYADRVSVFTMDLNTAGDYVWLKDEVDLQDDEQALIYLSVPPSAAADIVAFLGKAGLNSANVKLLLEKPFGFDLDSAQEYTRRIAEYYQEGQIYRIDHYAAKEIAQEIVRQRSEPDHSWSATSVTSVDVVAEEAIGIEDRASFYEETGALRDIIQGHLMQLLALVVMPFPSDFSPEKIADYRVQALDALNVADPAETVRAQYEGYRDEVNNPHSMTETFVSMLLHSSDSQWQDVPLRLTTGKSLNEKKTYIKLTHTDGTETILDEAKLAAEHTEFSDAYERVLVYAIEGNTSIFTTSPELLRAWEIVRPAQQSWDAETSPLQVYTPGATIDQVIAQ